MNTDSEKKAVGISYLYSFYMEVQNLINNYAQYLNLMIEIESKYPSAQELQKADEEHKNIVNQWLQNVRIYISTTYIKYKTLSSVLKLKDNPELDKKHKEILSKFVIDRNILEQYVIEMNKILITDIIQDLLENNTEYAYGANKESFQSQ